MSQIDVATNAPNVVAPESITHKKVLSKTNGSLTQKKEINQIVTQHFHICVFFLKSRIVID